MAENAAAPMPRKIVVDRKPGTEAYRVLVTYADGSASETVHMTYGLAEVKATQMAREVWGAFRVPKLGIYEPMPRPDPSRANEEAREDLRLLREMREHVDAGNKGIWMQRFLELEQRLGARVTP